MTRVLPAQLTYLSFTDDCRYQPVKKGSSLGGIICLIDKAPTESRELIAPSVPAAVTTPAGGTEAIAPNTSPVAAVAIAPSQVGGGVGPE